MHDNQIRRVGPETDNQAAIAAFIDWKEYVIQYPFIANHH